MTRGRFGRGASWPFAPPPHPLPRLGPALTMANKTLGFLRRNLAACPQDVKESARDWCVQSQELVFKSDMKTANFGFSGFLTMFLT